MKIFILISLFWALFDQTGSTWVLQAENMDRNFMGMQLEASQLQALNPLMVMVLIPTFTLGLYPLVERRFGIRVSPLRKMSTGMVPIHSEPSTSSSPAAASTSTR